METYKAKLLTNKVIGTLLVIKKGTVVTVTEYANGYTTFRAKNMLQGMQVGIYLSEFEKCK